MRHHYTAVLVTLCFTVANTARAQVPSIPDTISPQALQAHMQYQWRLLLITSILNAREHGQTPTQLGNSIGGWVSQRWGPNLQPQEFGRAIELRARRLGFATRVTEDADSVFAFEWSGPDSIALNRNYGSWGITVSDIQDFLDAMNVTITKNGGIVWTTGRRDGWRVARITRRP